MHTVPAEALPELRPWFAPERPGPMIFEHAARTGNGRCRVDRMANPRMVLAELPGNYALRGDPAALLDDGRPGELRDLAGFVEAPAEWLPALRVLDPGVGVWNRVVAALPAGVAVPSPRVDVRLLTPADAPGLAALPAESGWIHETWGGAAGLLAAGVARAAWVDGVPVSIAVPFWVGGEYEDIGVVTVPGYERRGLSVACAAALAGDIRARGHVPTWTTSPDNTGSLAVAARLGFEHVRDDVLYAVRATIPA